MDRTDGYVQEIEYTHRYCAQLAPGWLDLACAARGISTGLASRPPRYLELAFGQGVSVNIHAAACPGEYWGFDFNPAHAANARALAAAGSGAVLLDDSFAQFAAREDVPPFDVIAMHGTWSWVSAENRHLAIDIVRRKLAPGGVFFMSYNCLPGWATEMPLRHLLVRHAQASDDARGLAAKIDASLDFAQALVDAGAKYFSDHPGLKDWLADMRGRSRSYLAHEYFNRDWHPMPFSEVSEALAAAGVAFAASATLSDHCPEVGLSAAARDLLAGIDDAVLRETALDYFANRRFRRDVFVKGAPAPDPAIRAQRLRATPFMLLQHPDLVPRRVSVAGRTIELEPDACAPLIEALAEDGFTPKTLDQLARHPKCARIGFEKLARTALILTGEGSLHPVQAPVAIASAAPRCKALNGYILEQSARADDVPALASPVAGAGVFMARQEMLFLNAISHGCKSPDEWAAHASRSLATSDPATLLANARAFARYRLPVLEALGVA